MQCGRGGRRRRRKSLRSRAVHAVLANGLKSHVWASSFEFLSTLQFSLRRAPEHRAARKLRFEIGDELELRVARLTELHQQAAHPVPVYEDAPHVEERALALVARHGLTGAALKVAAIDIAISSSSLAPNTGHLYVS